MSTVVLTGAGVSVPSGIQPFRGPGGIWTENPGLEAKMTAGASNEDIWSLWKDFDLYEPNEIHFLLASIERAHIARGELFVLFTQNVDGLHQKAGSARVFEIHGSASRSYCKKCRKLYNSPVYNCVECEAITRPDVVLFGEIPHHLKEADNVLPMCDTFVAIGTSGEVWPACDFVSTAVSAQRRILINAEAWEHPHPDFTEVYIGDAANIIPQVFAEHLSEVKNG